MAKDMVRLRSSMYWTRSLIFSNPKDTAELDLHQAWAVCFGVFF